MSAKKSTTETQRRAGVEKPPAPRRGSVLARFPGGWRLALWVFLLLGAFAAQAITSMAQKSVTFDETAHLPAGYTYLKTGDYRMNAEHPPLAKMIAAFPLMFLKIDGAFQSDGWQKGDEWDYGWEFLFRGRNDANTVFFCGRLSMVILSLGLGLLIFFWARKLYGNAAGLFALALFAFCPNIIAHGMLTNTDVPIAFFFLLTLFCFDRALRRLTALNALLAGLAFGLALLTKFTAPLLLPIMAVVAVVRVLDRRPLEFGFWAKAAGVAETWRKKVIALVILFAVALPLAYGVLWAGYRFRFSAFSGGENRALPFSRPDIVSQTGLFGFLRDNRLLPQAYLEGFQYVRATAGRGSFLDGRTNADPSNPERVEAWPQYFIMTSLYKTPVPMLIFFVVAVGGAWWWSRKTWRQEAPLVAAFLIYFGVAVVWNMNIGHRHILPIIPLAFIFVSKIATRLRMRHALDTNIIRGIFAALLIWYAYGAISIYPNYLAYFNEIAGGPEHGPEHLTDSNIDWGQDLILLKKYMDEHHIKEIHLDYFGSADPRYYGIKFKVFSMFPQVAFRDMPTTLESGIARDDYIAISVTNLEETYFHVAGRYKEFREQPPLAKIGYSIYIYKSGVNMPPRKAGRSEHPIEGE